MDDGAGPARDIQVVLYALDPAVVTTAPTGERIPIADGVWLRLVGVDLTAGRSAPYVLSLSLELGHGVAQASAAQALWAFLRRRRGGRGVVAARIVRREERRVEQPDGTPVVERHELWFAIPLRSSRGARRRIDAFFTEVLQPS